MRALLASIALLLIAPVDAAELRIFGQGEMARILAERQGHPFILTLWSLDCPHCKGSLRQLATFAREHPAIDLLVINTDSKGESEAISTMLAATGLAKWNTWVFGDEGAERLRYEIDQGWAGEMPRTYLFNRDHQAVAFSGPIANSALKRWLTSGFANRPGGRYQ